MALTFLELESFSKYFHFIPLFSVLGLSDNFVPGLMRQSFFGSITHEQWFSNIIINSNHLEGLLSHG